MTSINTFEHHTDNRIKMLSITLLTKRSPLSYIQFQSYWRDIHGPVCARLNPLGLYIQHHLKRTNPDLLPNMDSISKVPYPDDWDGFAEIGFFSKEDLNKWIPKTSVLFEDEQYVFEKTVAHYCDTSSYTVKDSSKTTITNGENDRLFIYWLLQKRKGVLLQDATTFLTSHLIPVLATNNAVKRIRYHVLEEHDNSEPNPPAPNVNHFLANEHQYQFVLELAFDNKLAMKQVFEQPDFLGLIPGLEEYFQTIHAHESAGRYTMVYDGEVTQAGIRGATNARLIEEVGAIHQKQSDIVKLMYPGVND